MTATREQAELLNTLAGNPAFISILKLIVEEERLSLLETVFRATQSSDPHLAVIAAGRIVEVDSIESLFKEAARNSKHLILNP